MKVLNEQPLSAKVTSDRNLNINGQNYKLEVKKGLGWMGVNIDKLVPTKDGWQVTASKLGMSQTDVVPQDTINVVAKNLGREMIDLGGKTPKRLVKINENKVMKITEKQLNKLVEKVLKEETQENYMFFSNLRQMKRQCEMLLELDPNVVDNILQNGHDWADDHVTEAKTNMDQVFDFMMNETRKQESYIDFEDLNEAKKTGSKLCARGKAAAKFKFKVYPSAYANGYAVQVCKGKIKGLDGKKQCSGSYC